LSKRLSLVSSLALVLAVALLGAAAARAQKKPAASATSTTLKTAHNAAAQSAAPNGPSGKAKFVGNDTCVACHFDEAKAIDGNAHARLALQHGGQGDTCESCHGAGSEHVESGGDATKMFSFSKATPAQADAVCLSCHASAHPNFKRTAHGEAGVGCTSCHSAHHAKTEEAMLRQPQPLLCYSCHTDVKPVFEQAFHHKVNEGVMSCSDCHDPHGSFQRNNLRAAADQNQICMKCHSDTAGPFIYEHPPLKTEGCTSCHTPHGSQNARLLTQNNVNSLCMQCHTASSIFNAPGTPSFHNQANQYQACTVCHTQIHGSNASNIFFK
jgi:DmsE family decaheme c-type cytochrome